MSELKEAVKEWQREMPDGRFVSHGWKAIIAKRDAALSEFEKGEM